MSTSPQPAVAAVARAAPGGAKHGSSYIPGLDGIRAIAFLLVFGAHATPGNVSHYVPATLGVTIFFFLSGFLITTLLRKELVRTGTLALRDFYIRRTLRIFIPLYIVYAISVPFTRYVLHQFSGNILGAVSIALYFYNYAIVLGMKALPSEGMDVAWSLSVEEHFYILFPLLLLVMTRRKLSFERQTHILLGLCGLDLAWRLVLCLHFHQEAAWTYFATDARFDSILWGCVLALRNNPVFGDRSILPPRREALTFAGGVALMLCTLIPFGTLFRESIRYTLQAVSLYLIFSFAIAHIRHPFVRWLEWRPLRYIGWISYVLYLSHRLIADWTEHLFPGRVFLSAPLALLLAILFATAMRYTVELPLQRLRARFRKVPERDLTAADGHGLVS